MNPVEPEERLQAMFEEMGLGSEASRSYFKQFEAAPTIEAQRPLTFIRATAWTTPDLAKESQDAELA